MHYICKKIDLKPQKSTPKHSRKTEYSVHETSLLLPFLDTKMGGMTRTSLKQLLTRRQVTVNGTIQTNCNLVLNTGDCVKIDRSIAAIQLMHPKLNIIFENQHLIVVNKKEGLLTSSTGLSNEITAFSILKNYLKKADPRNRIYIVHRLDRETSGVLVFAKDRETQLLLQNNWHSDTKKRIYVAVVEGEMEEKKGSITSWLLENPKSLKVRTDNFDNGGKKSITHYRTIKSNNRYSLLQLQLETGRKNQIRVHLQSINHPISGDKKYGASPSPIGRIALHAQVLEFIDPHTKELLHFESNIPKNFYTLVNSNNDEKN